jgi:dTDP-4-amino-4,6-dideoxygalactose transaminase
MAINVTRPFVPAMEKYTELLEGIFSRQVLTNNGPLVTQLEAQLKAWLDVDRISYVTNGTVALQMAMRALELKGEVITTPFSFVATTSSIVWEGCRPVMADIDPHTLNIDPDQIRRSITRNTTGILATHVYGNPCDVDAIEQIAREYGLKVIYDAAHAFGTTVNGRSIFSYGDIAATSFHATKLFHTIEGGAVFASDPIVHERLVAMRNFGIVGDRITCVGLNGKNSEFHAAMGIANLESIDEILASRKALCERYDDRLEGTGVRRPLIHADCEYNHAYYPVIFDSEATLMRVRDALNREDVFPRRYFYPSLSTLDYVDEQHTPVANDIACRVLALPLYFGLPYEDLDRIARIVARECMPRTVSIAKILRPQPAIVDVPFMGTPSANGIDPTITGTGLQSA